LNFCEHIVFGFFLLIVCFSSAVYAQEATDIEQVISQGTLDRSWWSVTVLNQEGEALTSLNSEKLITPASNQKIFTLAAILDGLGSGFRFKTTIYGDAYLKDSVWMGDLVIRGKGDPSISGDLYDGDREYAFRNLARQLQDKGITRVNGVVYGHDNYFDDQVYPKGWDWDDLSFYYAVQTGALSFNNNAVDLTVLADGEIGEKPFISWYPNNTDFVRFLNNQVITSPQLEYDEFYRRKPGTNNIELGSSLPKGYKEEESLSVNNPSFFFLDTFIDYLNSNKIKVKEIFSLKEQDTEWESLEVLAVHESKPLVRLLEWANKESDNFYTEMLLKTLSAEKRGAPGNFEDGITLVREFLHNMQADTALVKMKDGSGMASGNLTTTGILAGFLFQMQSHNDFDKFAGTLSVAGIDGTLKHRFKDSPVYKNFTGKSGFVSGVRTLSGYLNTKKGNRLIVSIATNHFVDEVKDVDRVHEELIEFLYQTY